MMPRPTTPTVPLLRAAIACFLRPTLFEKSATLPQEVIGQARWHSLGPRFRLSLRRINQPEQRMTESAFMRIGVAGLGRMGAAMAVRLIEVGHDVTVWNRSAAKAKPLVEAGAKTAASAAALASAVETVITCLTDA